MKTKFLLLMFVQTLFVGCNDDSDNGNKTPEPIAINDTFNTSMQGWECDFADYPTEKGDSVFYELEWKHASLPEPLDKTKKAIMISGNNHSDDLFMFLRKNITGLIPGQTYEVAFEVELASDAASNLMGVGGAPGESVSIGVGCTATKPQKIEEQGYYRMNIKKINQMNDGEDMKLIGNIANGTEESKFVLIQRSGSVKAKADDKGEAWVIVGTDSGFEATTTLYYTNIKINFTPVEPDL